MLRKLAPFVVGIFFIVVGITHFTRPDFFVSIVPPYLPAPLALVYVSGFFEITGWNDRPRRARSTPTPTRSRRASSPRR